MIDLTTTIVTRLGGLETEFARKGFARPSADLSVGSSGKHRIYVWAGGLDPERPEDHRHRSFTGDDVETAFKAAETWIAEQPEPEVKDLYDFQRMLAKTIDFANEKQIDVKFVEPVVETARALATNLLTYQPGA